jgi:hypothetical protein
LNVADFKGIRAGWHFGKGQDNLPGEFCYTGWGSNSVDENGTCVPGEPAAEVAAADENYETRYSH